LTPLHHHHIIIVFFTIFSVDLNSCKYAVCNEDAKMSYG
jgi:hypothetical protein